MSLVVAVKDKDRFILGADKQVTYGMSFKKGHAATKVWDVVGLENCCMAAVGDGRVNQVLRCASFIVSKDAMNGDQIDENYIVNTLVDMIEANLTAKKIDVITTDHTTGREYLDFQSVFLFAYRDRCWRIDANGYVTEVEDFDAIGAGEDLAIGSLCETENLNPYERIAHCIQTASRYNASIDDSIEVVQTKVYEDDQEQFYKAVGIEIVEPEPEKKRRRKKKDQEELVEN